MSSSRSDRPASSFLGEITRRRLVQGSAVFLLRKALVPWTTAVTVSGNSIDKRESFESSYDSAVLPPGIRSRFIENVNGLRMHILEAGFEDHERPLVLLVHGFPELAYSWRRVMLPIAAAGFRVVAPDRRGFGRTSGWDVRYEDDVSPFFTLNQLKDVLALVSALGYHSVTAVIGHDMGSPMAAWCSLVRPDVFRSVVMMSAPFAGPPPLPFDTAEAKHDNAPVSPLSDPIYDELARLNPPRKHYQKYFATPVANEDMWHPPQGLHNFLRAYYHMKSADWRQNTPFALNARTAEEWAKLPRYYVMDLNKGMAETVAPEMPSSAAVASCKWLPDNELRVYSSEYERTGFQGGLNSYRVSWEDRNYKELQLFSGRTIDVPSLFVAGKSDWGVYQAPGALQKMQTTACSQMLSVHLLEGAGHWVQQEQSEEVSRLLVQFLQRKSANAW